MIPSWKSLKPVVQAPSEKLKDGTQLLSGGKVFILGFCWCGRETPKRQHWEKFAGRFLCRRCLGVHQNEGIYTRYTHILFWICTCIIQVHIYIYIYTHRWSSVPWSVSPQRYGTCGDLWVRGGMVVSWWWLVAVAVAVYKRTRDHMIYMCQYMYARRARIPLRNWVIVRLSWGTTHGTNDGLVKKWELQLQTTEGTSSKNKEGDSFFKRKMRP